MPRRTATALSRSTEQHSEREQRERDGHNKEDESGWAHPRTTHGTPAGPLGALALASYRHARHAWSTLARPGARTAPADGLVRAQLTTPCSLAPCILLGRVQRAQEICCRIRDARVGGLPRPSSAFVDGARTLLASATTKAVGLLAATVNPSGRTPLEPLALLLSRTAGTRGDMNARCSDGGRHAAPMRQLENNKTTPEHKEGETPPRRLSDSTASRRRS